MVCPLAVISVRSSAAVVSKGGGTKERKERERSLGLENGCGLTPPEIPA